MPVRTFSRREIAVGRQQLEVPLFGTVLLASAMFCHAEGGLLLLIASLLVVVLHWFATCRNRELFVRRTLLNGSVVLVGIVLGVRYFRGDQDLLLALSHYVMLVQLCKMFDRKGDRDYVQMLVMSLLLVLAASMICQDLLFALMAMVYLAFLCYTAMVFTLKRSYESSWHPVAGPRQPGWPRWALLSRLTVVLLALLATGVVVFLISPRSAGSGMPSLARMRSEGTSGFSEAVRLGEARSIYLSDRVMMHVRVTGPDGTNLGDVGPLYLRGHAFSEYVDSEWVFRRHRRGYIMPSVPPNMLGRTVRQEVSMVPELMPVMFASYPAVKVTSPDVSIRRLSKLEYELKNASYAGGPVRYTAYVLPSPLKAEDRDYLIGLYGQRGLAKYSSPVEIDAPEPVAQLARQWCADLTARRTAVGGAGTVRGDRIGLAIAERISQRLRRRCSYTLDLSAADADRDGVEDFLFHMRRGHCEYFASALTVMCRVLGVRARMATGFRPGEFDDDEGHYVVRQRDAHAWTEVFTASTGWTVVDATPAARFQPIHRSGWSRWVTSAADVWRKWEFAWYARVIGYDDETRRSLAVRVRSTFRSAWASVRHGAAGLVGSLMEMFRSGRVLAGIVWLGGALGVAAAMVAGLVALWRRMRGRQVRPAGPARPKPPRFLRQLLAVLRRHGIRPSASQTPRELAAEAARRLPMPVDVLDALVRLHYRIRWSGRPARDEELRDAEQKVRRIDEMLSSQGATE
jgi:transglutaminase-like putative cysteine protease